MPANHQRSSIGVSWSRAVLPNVPAARLSIRRTDKRRPLRLRCRGLPLHQALHYPTNAQPSLIDRQDKGLQV